MKIERVFYINGVDITRFVEDVSIDKDFVEDVSIDKDASIDEMVSGVRAIGPVTISGVWDDGRLTCCVCHERFTPGPEGAATLVRTSTGERFGPVCPACGTALVAPL